MSRRVARVALAGAVVVPVALAGCGREPAASACGSEPRVTAAGVSAVFGSAGDIGTAGDPRLERLARAADRWGLGTVVGAVGYDHDRWLTVAGAPGGLVAWTRDDPVVAVLDEDLAPRWGIRQRKGRHAWDLAAPAANRDGTFWQVRMPEGAPAEVTAHALEDGARRWCVRLGGAPTGEDDPMATTALADGGLLVLSADRGAAALLSRIDAGGEVTWRDRTEETDRGDALVQLDSGVVVAGGRSWYQLTDPAVPAPRGPALVALDPVTGRPWWHYGAGARLHVLGVADRLLLLEEATPEGIRVRALDRRGRVVWSRPLPAGAGVDGALRAGMLVLRTDRALIGLDATDGTVRWRRSYPQGRQYFPYGFALDQQPMLTPVGLLLPTTEALVVIDVRTGTRTAYPLPTDGVSTTFWPYQVAVSGRLLAVVTNTGALVLRR